MLYLFKRLVLIESIDVPRRLAAVRFGDGTRTVVQVTALTRFPH